MTSTEQFIGEQLIMTQSIDNDVPHIAVSAVILEVHPARAQLYEELHNRPYPLVKTPCCVTHISVLVSAEQRKAEYLHLVELCHRFTVNPPAEKASCFYQSFDGFELRWECHMEFSTYTFISCGSDPESFINNPYAGRALKYVPHDWLQLIPGQSMAAVHLAMAKGEQPLEQKHLDRAFEQMRLSGSKVAGNKAEVYTSFRIHSDGFSRVLVQDKSLNSYQAGRLMQRVLEIETYRIMALLSLPIARKLTPVILTMEEQLANINKLIASSDKDIDDNAMLTDLSKLAAKVEQFRSDTNYRFGGTIAYYDIVNARLRQLHEEEILGVQTLQEFIGRRLGPGIKTCAAVKERMENLSLRIAHTSSLLRTRVEISIEAQNQSLLTSMNQRSGMQLRLQQTVEGLSVAAISYYFMGLLSYIFDAVTSLNIVFNKSAALGIAVPIVIILSWLMIRKLMHNIDKSEQIS
jgi:uncharacterized membrane-anchored protein